jgi:tRNA(Ile)-lysidine synthase
LGKRAKKIDLLQQRNIKKQTMLNLETFKANWDKQFPDINLHETHFIVAVSGGVDSVVLTHLLHTLNATCTIAHVNFQLRGAESVRDENFVRDFAAQLKLPVEVHACETAKYAETYKMGIQQAAREIRYAWFGALTEKFIHLEKENIAHSNPKSVILLTAHHADDQVETVLMQLFRGTGIHGLTGIPARRKDVLNMARPLLIFTKDEIKAYAAANGLSYVEDSSNEKNDYTRNLIRNQLLPQVSTIYPMVQENILATSERLKEAEDIVIKTVEAFWKKGFKYKKGIPSIPISYWQKVKGNATYTWGLIKQYGFKPQQIEEVYKILEANKGAFIASTSHRFINWEGHIQIVGNELEKEYITIPETVISNLSISTAHANNPFNVKNGVLKFELLDNDTNLVIDKDPRFAYLDAAKMDWPLLYRSWESTDYFYPLGLRKKKKLNHFLGSLKLSPKIKERVTVISVSNRICWVVGKRIDDRFKIGPSTQKLLKITWEEAR